MSKATDPTTDDSDPWAELADHQERLEFLVDEDLPLAPYAERALAELERRGYR
jgi:hypothetical protein